MSWGKKKWRICNYLLSTIPPKMRLWYLCSKYPVPHLYTFCVLELLLPELTSCIYNIRNKPNWESLFYIFPNIIIVTFLFLFVLFYFVLWVTFFSWQLPGVGKASLILVNIGQPTHMWISLCARISFTAMISIFSCLVTDILLYIFIYFKAKNLCLFTFSSQ